MLAARKECLGTIELPAQRSFIETPTDAHQDDTLAELFHRLGQSGDICLVASPIKNRLADVNRLPLSPITCEVTYTPANLIELEVELAQELSMVVARLQR